VDTHIIRLCLDVGVQAGWLGSPASKPGTRRFQAQDGEPRPVTSATAIAVPRAEKTLSYK